MADCDTDTLWGNNGQSRGEEVREALRVLQPEQVRLQGMGPTLHRIWLLIAREQGGRGKGGRGLSGREGKDKPG